MNKRIILAFLFCLWLLHACNSIINPAHYRMLVKQGAKKIEHISGKFDFGTVTVQSMSDIIEFSIENIGKIPLKLTGSQVIKISGLNHSEFSSDASSTKTEIAPKTNTKFAITFSPTSEGAKSATVLIENDTNNQNPYTFTIMGTAKAIVYQPEICVKQGNTDIPCTTGIYDFGSVSVGSSSIAAVFTIENLGNAILNLTGYPAKIALDGSSFAMFSINQTLTNSLVQAGSSTAFSISFNPTSGGVKTTKVVIQNNDADENPYTFTVQGKGIIAPEINVKQGSDNIPCTTGSFGFGNVGVGATASAIFTVENLGTAILHLNGTPIISITGTDANQFADDVYAINTNINPGSSTTFSLSFKPTSVGNKSATVSIPNNDSDENPYIFTITGTGIPAPEINIKQGAVNIPCTTGSYDFGGIIVGSSSSEIIFTIENLGTANLELSGTPKIAISGTDAAMFAINQTTTVSPLSPSSSTTFNVSFSPTNTGNKTANISIANNDFDENPFIFEVKGRGRISSLGIAVGWIGGASNGWKTSNGTSSGADYQSFRIPNALFVDSAGNIYVTEYSNHRVSKWDSNGNAIGWLGGASNGWQTGTAPANYGYDYQSFRWPWGVFVDAGGFIYVCDYGNHRICKWDSSGNAIGWLGGGSNGWKTGTAPSTYGSDYRSFYQPSGVFVDSSAYIFVADYSNHRISKWSSNGNAVGWFGGGSNGWKTTSGASSGTGYQSFDNPAGLTLDAAGNIYVADLRNHRICKWSNSAVAIGWCGGASDGWKTGTAPAFGTDYQSFNFPYSVSYDASGFIFVAESSNNRISKWDSSGNAIGWLGGASDGWKTGAAPNYANDYRSFRNPTGVFFESSGYIFIADYNNHRICKWQD